MILKREQIQTMGRAAFFLRVHAFLSERVRLPAVREALSRRERVFALWNRVLDGFDTGSEYRSAVIISYALCQECAGVDPIAALRQLLADREPEYGAKCYFEDAGVLRFSEFDVPPELRSAAQKRGVE